MSGTTLLRGSTNVRGPGQKAVMRSCAPAGRSDPPVSSPTLPASATWRMRGLSAGRPFASKMPATASGSRPNAPNPYTVSVGKATNPPARRMPAAASTRSPSPAPERSRWTSSTRVPSPERLLDMVEGSHASPP